MGFYTTASECERREKTHVSAAKPSGEDVPPSKNRVWDFSKPSPICTRQSASQVLDLHREKQPIPTIIVSGVRYYGFRYYNPELGRWMSRDPIGTRGGMNSYGFVNNGPLFRYDLLGMFSETSHGGGLYPPWYPDPPVSTPYCAALFSIVENFLGGMDDYSSEFTSFYERRFPKTSAGVRADFQSRISSQVSGSGCSGGTISLASITPIKINGYDNTERSTAPNPRTEEYYGDTRQGDMYAAIGLGNYSISVASLEATECDCVAGCEKSIKWTATVAVYDTLGYNPANVDPPAGDEFFDWLYRHIAGEERNVIIAKWTLNGTVCCE